MAALNSPDVPVGAGFIVIGAAFEILFVCRLLYGIFHYRRDLKISLLSCLRAARQVFAKATHEELLVKERVIQLRLSMARAYVRGQYALVALGVLAFMLREQLQDSSPLLSAMNRWNILGYFAWCGLLEWFPTLLNVHTLNLFYIATSLWSTAQLSPWHVLPQDTTIISLCILAFIRLPAAGIATSTLLVAVCNTLPLIMCALRAIAEPMPLIVLCAEISGLIAAVTAAASVQATLSQRAEHSIMYKKMACDLNASSSLLHLTCDAVIELDEDLRIAEHAPALAAMLLRHRPGSTLAGMDFTDLLAGPAEAGRVTELLRRFEDRPQDTVNAQAFQTELVDTDSNRFETEVFQVLYHTPDGKARHLLGLRDVTDQGALAGSRAVESISVMPRSFTPLSVGGCSSCDSQLKASASANLDIMQTKTFAADKFLSLQIDMDIQVVHASSHRGCLGKRPKDLFCAAGVGLLESAWAQDQRDSSTISFSALELQPKNTGQLVNGTIHLLQTLAGHKSLLIHFVLPSSLGLAPRGSFDGSMAEEEEETISVRM